MKKQQNAKPQNKKQPPKQKAKQPPKPRMKWQTGEYSRTQEVRLDQPYQFLLLCKLVGVPPMQMLDDFMTNLSGDSWKRATNEGCRSTAVEYFMQCGYGQDFYTEADMRQVLKELDAIGSLWPNDAGLKLINRQSKWRRKYHDYWFKKWYRKLRRKP